MSGHDHEYALTVRPNAYLRVAYSTDDDGLERGVLAVEYGRDGLEGDEGTGGLQWRGYEISFARDGRTLLGHDLGSALDHNIERLLATDSSPVDAKRVLRGIDTAAGYGGRVRQRLGALRGRGSDDEAAISVETPEAPSPPETVEIPGPGGATIEVSLSETSATFEPYEDGGGSWRWRLTHDDGRTLAVSPSGYDSREAAEDVITAVKTSALGAEIDG